MMTSGSLAGIRVLELPAIGPVPFCDALLADMGADVVRIDRATAVDGTAMPPKFDFYNRNKRSVALDLKAPAAVEAALMMIGKADILIEDFRPGVAERLGLGPSECLALNPRLVYGRMTGWGQDGPMAQVVGHDINYLALSGALHCIGEKGRPPAPPLNLVADLGGGAMYLAVGVLAGLTEARRSGRGQVVDTAMVDGVANLMSAFFAFRQMGEWTSERGENIVDGGAPFYGTYETRDGKYVAVGAIEARFYAALINALGLEPAELPPQNDRSTWAQTRERFAAIFRTRTRDEWVETMRGRDACFAPVLDLDEATTDAHQRARGVFTEFDGVRHPTPAPRFGRTPAALRRPAPAPGQHSAEVFAEWGVGASAIEALARSGAMLQAGPGAGRGRHAAAARGRQAVAAPGCHVVAFRGRRPFAVRGRRAFAVRDRHAVAVGGQRAAEGALVRVMCAHFVSTVSALGSPGVDNLRWLRPVRPGDRLRMRVTVLEVRRSARQPDRGTVNLRQEAINQDGEVVMSLEGRSMHRCHPAVHMHTPAG